MATTLRGPLNCPGCGRVFQGGRGLLAHQSSRGVAMGCQLPASPQALRAAIEAAKARRAEEVR